MVISVVLLGRPLIFFQFFLLKKMKMQIFLYLCNHK